MALLSAYITWFDSIKGEAQYESVKLEPQWVYKTWRCVRALYAWGRGPHCADNITEIVVVESVRFGLDLWTLGLDKLLEVI